jgi:hypothetical protein
VKAYANAAFFEASNASGLLLSSTTCERETKRAAEQSKIQVVEALQDTGRCSFSHSEFLDFDHTLGYPSRFLSGAYCTGRVMPGV